MKTIQVVHYFITKYTVTLKNITVASAWTWTQEERMWIAYIRSWNTRSVWTDHHTILHNSFPFRFRHMDWVFFRTLQSTRKVDYMMTCLLPRFPIWKSFIAARCSCISWQTFTKFCSVFGTKPTDQIYTIRYYINVSSLVEEEVTISFSWAYKIN